MGLPMDLVLIRHGESEINAAQSRLENGESVDAECLEALRQRPDALFRLTDAGILQAKIAGNWIRRNFMQERPFDAHLVSCFNRGFETAGYLLPEIGWDLNIFLQERDWGDLVGIPRAERHERFGDVFDRRKKDPLFCRIPNGESLAGECVRTEKVQEYLEWKYPNKRALIVTHGELIWCFRIINEGVAPWQFREMYHEGSHWIPNCGILHYSRRDPKTGVICSSDFAWVRAINPLEEDAVGPWVSIQKQLWLGEDLIKAAEKTPRIFN